jgi:hypothetical protein
VEVVAVFFATGFLTAVFFGAACCVFATSALFSAQRFFVAATIAFLPASEAYV